MKTSNKLHPVAIQLCMKAPLLLANTIPEDDYQASHSYHVEYLTEILDIATQGLGDPGNEIYIIKIRDAIRDNVSRLTCCLRRL